MYPIHRVLSMGMVTVTGSWSLVAGLWVQGSGFKGSAVVG